MSFLRTALSLAGLVVAAFLGCVTPMQAGEQTLALKGYDTVAYFTEKHPMVGDAQYEYEWDGATYRFASAKHLALFKADPDRYLPQFHSWCTASVAKGEKVPGNPEYWLVLDGRLYLFGKPVGADMMRANAEGMRRRASANWTAVSRLPNPRE